MTRFFSSDWHFSHPKVAELRGFDTIELHDEWLMDTIAEKMRSKKDIMFFLGDLALSVTGINKGLDFIKTLPGSFRMIAGNHDRCAGLLKGSSKWVARYMEAFDSVNDIGTASINGEDFILYHYPFLRPDTEVKYAEYRLTPQGKRLLCGHTHCTSFYTDRDDEFQIGIDTGKIYAEGELCRLTKAGKIC